MSQAFRKAKRPRDLADIVAQYLSEGNLDAIVSFFHPECKVAFPPSEPPKFGHKDVRAMFAPFVSMQPRPKLISEVTGELINGGTALLQADWRIESEDGELLASGSSTEVAKQHEDGSWLYFIDCPMGPPAT